MPWCAGPCVPAPPAKAGGEMSSDVPRWGGGMKRLSYLLPTRYHWSRDAECRPPINFDARLSTGESWVGTDGGMRKCSAGACPPLGRRRGVAEPTVPIRRTKPQLRLSIPWCAGPCRHERLQ